MGYKLYNFLYFSGFKLENNLLLLYSCAADDSFERDTPPIHLADAFHFNAFAWFDESSDQVLTASVYLHCDVRACPEGESFCDITGKTNHKIVRIIEAVQQCRSTTVLKKMSNGAQNHQLLAPTN